jgi:peptidoglycan/LPS O-acetylase OafA/YrhL
MRVSFVVYAVLYVVIEVVVRQLEVIGWPRITALDVATALTNALLGVAVAAAVLVAIDVLARRWRRSMQTWEQDREEWQWPQEEPIEVRSWRSPPLALPPSPGPTGPSVVRPYGERSYAAHAFPGGRYADRSSGDLEDHLL